MEVEGLDRAALFLSSLAVEPVCYAYDLLRYRLVAPLTPGQYNNCVNKTLEIVKRALIAIAAFIFVIPLLSSMLVLGLSGKSLRAIGFSLQKNNYTYVKGNAPEITGDQSLKLLTWNICGVAGGMHYDHGGVLGWRSRIDQIVAKIVKENPDVIYLQEIYDTALAESLVQKLKAHYPHFYMHLGANVLGSVGGGMMITRAPVKGFKNISFANNDWTLNRTFSVLEVGGAKPARIIGTHLIHNNNAKRMEQVAQIVNHIALEKIQAPTVLMGDLNLERDLKEEGKTLDKHFIHSHKANIPTCTNAMLNQWFGKTAAAVHETIDYISLYRDDAFPNAKLDEAKVIESYTPSYDVNQALSDHHGLVSVLSY
jgi:endonuclease/exonuclease/phosphatase family metal-dependent hydrolase